MCVEKAGPTEGKNENMTNASRQNPLKQKYGVHQKSRSYGDRLFNISKLRARAETPDTP